MRHENDPRTKSADQLNCLRAIQNSVNWDQLTDVKSTARKLGLMDDYRRRQELLLATGCAGCRPIGMAFDFDRAIIAIKIAVVAAIRGNQLTGDEVTRDFIIRTARTLPLRELAGVPADADEGDVGFWVKQQLRSDKASGKLAEDLSEEVPDISHLPAEFRQWLSSVRDAMMAFVDAPENADHAEMRELMRFFNPILRDLFAV